MKRMSKPNARYNRGTYTAPTVHFPRLFPHRGDLCTSTKTDRFWCEKGKMQTTRNTFHGCMARNEQRLSKRLYLIVYYIDEIWYFILYQVVNSKQDLKVSFDTLAIIRRDYLFYLRYSRNTSPSVGKPRHSEICWRHTSDRSSIPPWWPRSARQGRYILDLYDLAHVGWWEP